MSDERFDDGEIMAQKRLGDPIEPRAFWEITLRDHEDTQSLSMVWVLPKTESAMESLVTTYALELDDKERRHALILEKMGAAAEGVSDERMD